MATILCIDNDPAILGVLKALLGSKGYTVLTATDGLNGIALTHKHSIDAIVLDFDMPGMDGAQVAQVLMKEQPTTPVVICSGSDQIPEWLMWFADGCYRKGDDPAVLRSTIDKLVVGRKKPVRIVRASEQSIA